MFFAVRLERGSARDWSRDLRRQDGERLPQDNWAQNGMLTIKSIEPSTILLDGRSS
jgi:hypothetical protein